MRRWGRTAAALAALIYLCFFWRAALLLAGWLVNAFVLVHLTLVSLRRIALTITALAGHDTPSPPLNNPPPRLTALVPCRDEASALPATLAAWEAVNYPRDRLQLVLIDDASTDQTPALLDAFAAAHPWATVLHRDGPPSGKGAALQAGLAAAAPSEAVAVFDADARPAPDCLERLVAPLADPAVDAVAGRMIPDESDDPAAAHAAIEAAVHQRLTITGAAWLGATVPLLGSAYLVRRPALERLGFSPEHRLEDIDLAVRLLIDGGRIAWAPQARCAIRPPADAAAFRAQRIAWSRGFHRVAREHLGALVAGTPSYWLAIDRALFCGAYLDRLTMTAGVLLCALAATVARSAIWMPWWFLGAVAALPLLQALIAMRADGWPWARVKKSYPRLCLWRDVAAELAAWLMDLRKRPLAWRKTPRAGEEKT